MRFLLFLGLLIGCSGSKKISTNNETMSVLDQFRAQHLQSLLKSENGPLDKKDLKNIDFFDHNPDLRIVASFEKNEQPEPLVMATYAGKEKEFIRYGTAFFQYDGINLTLNVYQNLKLVTMPQYRDHLFLPFKDITNDDMTYGGGRYIDMKLSDISDSEVVIDFNRSYNPWCAYSEGYNCPIPPLDNHLPIPILAGEKAYKGKKKS